MPAEPNDAVKVWKRQFEPRPVPPRQSFTEQLREDWETADALGKAWQVVVGIGGGVPLVAMIAALLVAAVRALGG